jgi:hypothetical protein
MAKGARRRLADGGFPASFAPFLSSFAASAFFAPLCEVFFACFPMSFVPSEKDFLTEEKDFLTEEKDFLTEEKDFLTEEKDFLTEEKDFLMEEKDFLTEEKDFLTEEKARGSVQTSPASAQ